MKILHGNMMGIYRDKKWPPLKGIGVRWNIEYVEGFTKE